MNEILIDSILTFITACMLLVVFGIKKEKIWPILVLFTLINVSILVYILYSDQKYTLYTKILACISIVVSVVIFGTRNYIIKNGNINFFLPSSSQGLLTDTNIIRENMTASTFVPTVNIENLLDRSGWFFPNLEWSSKKDLDSSKTIICKTKQCYKLLKEEYGHRDKNIWYTGFTSNDKYLSKYTKDYNRFLHIGGKSIVKGTKYVLETWYQHPEWPRLDVVCFGTCAEMLREDNIELKPKCSNVVIHGKLNDEDFIRLMNVCGCILCPSETEGFGHTLNEARSCAAVVLYTNAAPINELFTVEIGIPIDVVNNKKMMGMLPLQKVSTNTLSKAVQTYLKTPIQKRKMMGMKARKSFLEDRGEFKRRLNCIAFNLDPDIRHNIITDLGGYGTIISSEHLTKGMYKGKIGIVMAIFGRPKYLEKSLKSLRYSNIKNAVIVLVDESNTKFDNRVTNEVRELLVNFNIKNIPILKIFKNKHGNMFDSYKNGMDLLLHLGVENLMTVDSDAIVKRNWLPKLLDLHNSIKNRPCIVTGFHTIMNNHDTISLHPSFRTKTSIGGINILFDHKVYKNIVRPALKDLDWDWNTCNSINEVGGIIACTVPSVVSHIGEEGVNSSLDNFDGAADFYTSVPALSFGNIINPYSPQQELMYWEDPIGHFPNTVDFEEAVKTDLISVALELPREPAHCVIDGGAHIGDFSVPIAHALKSAGREDIIVYAIEPDKNKCEFIRRMVKANALTNLKVISVGLSDKEGKFEPDPNYNGYIGNKKNTGGQPWISSENGIDFATLDSLVTRGFITERIGCIHYDLEGMEPEALKGTKTCLETFQPYLSLEVTGEDNVSSILPYYYKKARKVVSNVIYEKISFPNMTEKQKKNSIKIDIALAKSFCKADTPGCSQFDQAGILNQVFTQIGTTNKYFVEFGARRPQVLNSSYFRMKKDWQGLLMDGDPGGNAPNCDGLQPGAEKLLNEPLGAPVILRKEFLTKENINQIFEKYKVPKSFDLLTIDIDKNDYHLMDALNTKSFSPRVVAIEFSSYFNSNENCIPVYKPDNIWDGDSVTNSSLAALNNLMNSKGYSYITHASGEHAIFVRNTELSPIDVNKSIPHTIKKGWQNEIRENPKLKHRYNPDHFICK